ncbi:STM4015 family protein [Streptomyces sp. H10-C2]|uniref:STM4015 family protein n=1 Tax=unclassified Streptomyces TaxID=2593676 RepID=UPI0024B94779|nr:MULTISPECIES: STM4015 family protein [unclassified Streptomyces]MDJ0346031.1 STM4015 family protein [Streptomyces sp. PH10-H1]MDJ0372959.1 STM4015 family protein [Streptomyces sp. H10-C2]
MSAVEHLHELHGLPAFDFPGPDSKDELPAPDAVAWRLTADPHDDDSDEEFGDVWDRFLDTVDPSRVRAIIIGQWGEAYEEDSTGIVEDLVDAKHRLTALEAVFIGDLEPEQAEISWIEQSDVTPVLAAYPELREFGARGGTGLLFPAVRHEHLRTLTFEAGGLPADVVRGVAASELPALEYLELWLGVEEYSGDATIADLAPILAGTRFPALHHLGLRNSEIQDEIAAAVASAPVVARLTSLDLSLGVLTDNGAAALLAGQPLTHLQWLDLHHHFLSDPIAQRLRDALEPSGVEVDLSEPAEPWNSEGVVHRFTAVAE